MKLTKIIIDNFKSIEHVEIEVEKYGSSYTTMFLGINESGKSNILDAISFFDVPSGDFNFEEYHNMKDKEKEYIDLFFYLEFEKKDTFLTEFKKTIKGGELLNLTIENINKNVYLTKDESSFNGCYNYDIKFSSEVLYIKEITTQKVVNGVNKQIPTYEIVKDNKGEGKYIDLNEENFTKCFGEIIDEIIGKYEPSISVWKPSENKYLLGDVDLNTFKDDISSNIPLKNIFAIAGYDSSDEIIHNIDSISTNTQLRRKLSKTFSTALTKYVKDIWKHNVRFDIEFSDKNKCCVSVLDEGPENEFDFFKMTSRSEGFKHFISLILSLSVETKKLGKNNRIIIIDEPEVHLHPSGIRDLRDELLKIGENNYVFIATHSPFIVDKNHKERNILVEKNNLAITNIFPIKDEDNILDDEVLSVAFGVNVYKDLLLPNKILVEGITDKIILGKLLDIKKLDNCGITNGNGSNIVSLASIYNREGINMIILVDSDKEGMGYKDKILKMGGCYTNENVFTIKDLVGNIKDGATIEDIFPKLYIENSAKQFFQDKFRDNTALLDIVLEDNKPFMEQIKIYFSKVMNKNLESYEIDGIKKIISDGYMPTKKNIEENDLINNLITNLINIIKAN